MIDIRPKVSSYTVLENVRSPFEFFGRTFTASGSSARNILDPSDESINLDFSYFVGRVDRIFLDKTGNFKFNTEIHQIKENLQIQLMML